MSLEHSEATAVAIFDVCNHHGYTMLFLFITSLGEEAFYLLSVAHCVPFPYNIQKKRNVD